jgi:hypothetical protein
MVMERESAAHSFIGFIFIAFHKCSAVFSGSAPQHKFPTRL